MSVELSIIIINYNTFNLTCKCITSIYSYTREIQFEIILVDNNSSECDPYLFVERFPFIKLIKNETNVGFAKGNNVGITYAIGNTILLLNSDTEVFDNAIGIAFKTLQSLNQSVGVITGKLIFPSGDIQHNCGRFPSILLQLIELLRIQKLLLKANRENLMLGGFFSYDYPVYPDWIWGTFFMFKREVLNCFPAKKLSETFFMYIEDLEWCYVIRKKWEIYFEPSARVIHYAGSSSIPFYGSNLNPMIKKKFKQIVVSQNGLVWSRIYFFLVWLNGLISKSQRGSNSCG